MLAVRSIEATQEKYVRNSIRVYFEGTRNLRWIVGVIDGAKAQARVIVEIRFSQYAKTQAYRDLMAEL